MKSIISVLNAFCLEMSRELELVRRQVRGRRQETPKRRQAALRFTFVATKKRERAAGCSQSLLGPVQVVSGVT